MCTKPVYCVRLLPFRQILAQSHLLTTKTPPTSHVSGAESGASCNYFVAGAVGAGVVVVCGAVPFGSVVRSLMLSPKAV